MQKQARCENKIEELLSELDKIFSHQEVNDALDRIFNPAKELSNLPRTSDQLIKGLEELNPEFGDDMVTNALYEVDKRRNPSPHMEPIKASEPVDTSKSESVVSEMGNIFSELGDAHPDAYEILGGSDQHYHIEELPLNGSPEEVQDLQEALLRLQELKTIANDTTQSPEERKARLEAKAKEFSTEIFGI